MNETVNKTTAQDLIYLVSCAVNQIKPDKEKYAAMDDAALFRMARRQKLSALTAYAIKQITPLTDPWKEAWWKAVRLHALYGKERAKILQKMDERGIWYLPLKGIILNGYYPDPPTREMSDNDILCDPRRMEEVREIMTGLGFSCKLYGRFNHDKYQKTPLSFEMHRSLFVPDIVPQIAESDFFMNIRDKLIRDDGSRCAYHLKEEDFYIYILCHIYKHYINSGTGLRSLIDIYVYNRAKGKELDRQYIEEQLELLGVREFEQQARRLAFTAFSGEPLTQELLCELTYFIESGCFGSGTNKYANRLRRQDGKNAKRKYLVKRIFPNETFLKSFYPTVYRHRILYPFLVVYRPFKGLVTKRKKLVRELKYIRSYKEDGEK